MYYGKLSYCDTANGTGCRTVFFVSGCRRHCPECFNQDTWNFTYGSPYNTFIKQKILDSLEPDYIDGLTILGGEPMEPENQPYIMDLVKDVKAKYPNKTIWLYSGYTFEELTGLTSLRQDMTDDLTGKSISHTMWTAEILKNIDILVDGPFHINEKNLMLAYRGSANQRILDVQESLATNQPILSAYMDLDRNHNN